MSIFALHHQRFDSRQRSGPGCDRHGSRTHENRQLPGTGTGGCQVGWWLVGWLAGLCCWLLIDLLRTHYSQVISRSTLQPRPHLSTAPPRPAGRHMGNIGCQRRRAAAAVAEAAAAAEEEEGRARRARVRVAWRRATRRVLQLLRLRRRWSDLGRWLQQPWVPSIVAGLERRHGVVVRITPAATAERLRAARRR